MKTKNTFRLQYNGLIGLYELLYKSISGRWEVAERSENKDSLYRFASVNGYKVVETESYI